MTGSEMKQLRQHLGEAIGKKLSTTDMARLCGLPPENGPETILKWEVTGPSQAAAGLLRMLAMASDCYSILDSFNIFDRFDFDEKQRPAHREAFRAQIKHEVLRRIGY